MKEKADKSKNEDVDKHITASDVKFYFTDLFKEFIDLDHGVDKEGTISIIKAKQSMSGANAWMLMCSIMIASIGLNLDSQAVIIGAMLISPLMSPLLGIGTGVAINDRDALYHALMHFGAAIIIALLTSIIYFWLSPLDELTKQILDRTSPTFFDIIIAVFGGIAGIVSIARKDVSTTLPGVAIATALMPPLCVTGFGIANGLWDVASKSFYLFFLNSFFVAFATYLILRRMHFPYKEHSSKEEQRKNIMIVGFFSLIMIIPSFLIFRNVYVDYKFSKKIETFVNEVIGNKRIYLDDYTLSEPVDGQKLLLLKVYGEVISDKDKPAFKNALDSLGLKNISIQIIPTTEIKLEKFNELEAQVREVGERYSAQIDKLKEEREEQREVVNRLKSNSDYLIRDSVKFESVNSSLKILMPEIEEIGMALMQYKTHDDSIAKIPTVIVEWKRPSKKRNKQLHDYIKLEYNLDTLKLIEK